MIYNVQAIYCGCYANLLWTKLFLSDLKIAHMSYKYYKNKNPAVLSIIASIFFCIRLKFIFILSNGSCKIVIKTNKFPAKKFFRFKKNLLKIIRCTRADVFFVTSSHDNSKLKYCASTPNTPWPMVVTHTGHKFNTTAGNTHRPQKRIPVQFLFIITLDDIMVIQVIRRCVIRNGLI